MKYILVNIIDTGYSTQRNPIKLLFKIVFLKYSILELYDSTLDCLLMDPKENLAIQRADPFLLIRMHCSQRTRQIE